MSEAKEAIIGKIKHALQDVPGEGLPQPGEVSRTYRQRSSLSPEETVALFAERVGDYEATVNRIKVKQLTGAIKQTCQKQNIETLVVPLGIPDVWLPESVKILKDHPDKPLTHKQLDAVDGVLTGSALAVGQTGTIILDAGQTQGRRALTLLPDYHLCVVKESQVVELLPEAMTHFNDEIEKTGPPITFISGPSATSDIELSRVEGVHGPRRLEVLIIGD